jgi:hypothetical protein
VTVNASYSQIIRDTLCSGAAYLFNGNLLTQAGTYVQSAQTVSGCDSTLTLELTVLPENLSSMTVTICDGDQYIWQGQTLTIAGRLP